MHSAVTPETSNALYLTTNRLRVRQNWHRNTVVVAADVAAVRRQQRRKPTVVPVSCTQSTGKF